MNLSSISADAVPADSGDDLPHLGGPAAAVRQVLAAHFVRGCEHIVEIGGHLRPLTGFLTHHPRSVLMVDPKAVPLECEELNGRPCRVRHVARKFQELDYDYAPGSYALVLLGFSLKPFGSRDPLGECLYRLLDHARVVVLEYPPALERASAQVPQILARGTLRVKCSLDLRLDDAAIRGSAWAQRRFIVLEPACEAIDG